MADKVFFYVLNQKFVEQETDIPEAAQQVMYYSLAIGHHVGVIDCLKSVIECDTDDYQKWYQYLTEGTEAYLKFARLLKFGEITIDISHVNLLADAFMAVRGEMVEPYRGWTDTLLQLFQAMTKEPAMYLMIKRVA